MAEDTQKAPTAPRVDDHIAAATAPEQHLLTAHKLSIQVQGKPGQRGHAVWSLTRQERGKEKTLTVHEGTRLEAAHHFFNYIHPDKTATPTAPARRSTGSYQPRPRTGRPQGSSQGRPPARPQSRPPGPGQGRPSGPGQSRPSGPGQGRPPSR